MHRSRTPAEVVATILSIGVAAALNVMTAAALYTAIKIGQPLGENSAQILLAWGGGALGVIGAFAGYGLGRRDGEDKPLQPPRPPGPPATPRPSQH